MSLLFSVTLSVPRRSGWRAWGAVRGDFERRLAAQESPAVIAPQIDREIRKGRDYVRVVIVATVDVADVAEALDLAWCAFRKAAGDDLAGWDLAGASAEVGPGAALAGAARRSGENSLTGRGADATRGGGVRAPHLRVAPARTGQHDQECEDRACQAR